MKKTVIILAGLAAAVLLFVQGTYANENLPPVSGPKEPLVKWLINDDNLHAQTWFHESFLDLKEDIMEAKAAGKRYAIFFEQRGCIYCKKMHEQVLSQKYINDFVRENYTVVQINLWGDREVTDFDGETLTEKKLAKKWGVVYTPTIVFLADGIEGKEGKSGKELIVSTIPGAFGPYTFYDMFTWVKVKGYKTAEHFQKFHARRLKERGLF